MDQVFTDAQVALVKTTVERVVKGEITRDDAQRLLTNAGIPVLKIDYNKALQEQWLQQMGLGDHVGSS